MTVRVIERARDLAGNPQCLVYGELSLAIESRAQRLTLDERHHVIELAVSFARIVDREYVRVAQMRDELYLSAESLRAEGKADVVA